MPLEEVPERQLGVSAKEKPSCFSKPLSNTSIEEIVSVLHRVMGWICLWNKRHQLVLVFLLLPSLSKEMPKNTNTTPHHYASRHRIARTCQALISLPMNSTERRMLKNLRVVVMVDSTSGGKCLTV